VVWRRNDDGQYARAESIDAPNLQRNQERAHELSRPARPLAQFPVRAGDRLVITEQGFINLDMVCEYRLRYENVTVSDTVDGIDATMANGSIYHFQYNDPGFEGFDTLVDHLEAAGYVISTKTRD